MRRLAVAFVLVIGCARAPETPLRDAAEIAEAELGAPADLLLAIGWTSSRLQMRDGVGDRAGVMGIDRKSVV